MKTLTKRDIKGEIKHIATHFINRFNKEVIEEIPLLVSDTL